MYSSIIVLFSIIISRPFYHYSYSSSLSLSIYLFFISLSNVGLLSLSIFVLYSINLLLSFVTINICSSYILLSKNVLFTIIQISFFFIWFCGFFLFCSKNIFEIFFITFIYFYAQNPNKTKFLKNLSKTSIIPVFFTHPVYLYNIVFRPECPGRYPKVQDGVYQGADRETRKRVP